MRYNYTEVIYVNALIEKTMKNIEKNNKNFCCQSLIVGKGKYIMEERINKDVQDGENIVVSGKDIPEKESSLYCLSIIG